MLVEDWKSIRKSRRCGAGHDATMLVTAWPRANVIL
jgi:hypothetical protein